MYEKYFLRGKVNFTYIENTEVRHFMNFRETSVKK